MSLKNQRNNYNIELIDQLVNFVKTHGARTQEIQKEADMIFGFKVPQSTWATWISKRKISLKRNKINSNISSELDQQLKTPDEDSFCDSSEINNLPSSIHIISQETKAIFDLKDEVLYSPLSPNNLTDGNFNFISSSCPTQHNTEIPISLPAQTSLPFYNTNLSDVLRCNISQTSLLTKNDNENMGIFCPFSNNGSYRIEQTDLQNPVQLSKFVDPYLENTKEKDKIWTSKNSQYSSSPSSYEIDEFIDPAFNSMRLNSKDHSFDNKTLYSETRSSLSSLSSDDRMRIQKTENNHFQFLDDDQYMDSIKLFNDKCYLLDGDLWDEDGMGSNCTGSGSSSFNDIVNINLIEAPQQLTKSTTDPNDVEGYVSSSAEKDEFLFQCDLDEATNIGCPKKIPVVPSSSLISSPDDTKLANTLQVSNYLWNPDKNNPTIHTDSFLFQQQQQESQSVSMASNSFNFQAGMYQSSNNGYLIPEFHYFPLLNSTTLLNSGQSDILTQSNIMMTTPIPTFSPISCNGSRDHNEEEPRGHSF